MTAWKDCMEGSLAGRPGLSAWMIVQKRSPRARDARLGRSESEAGPLRAHEHEEMRKAENHHVAVNVDSSEQAAFHRDAKRDFLREGEREEKDG